MKRGKTLFLTLCVGLALTACAKEDANLDGSISSETATEITSIEASNSQEKSDVIIEDSSGQDEKVEIGNENEESEDITIETIKEITSYEYQLDRFGSFGMVMKYVFEDYPNNSNNFNNEGTSITYNCVKNSLGYCEISATAGSGDGSYQIIYQNNDPDDLYVYTATEIGVERYEKDDEMQGFAQKSMFCSREDSRLVSVDRDEGTIVAIVDTYYAGNKEETYEIAIDEASTKLLSVSAHSDMANVTIVYEFDYDSPALIDNAAKDRCMEYYGDITLSDTLVFDTVDINGSHVTEEMIKGSKVVLLNLWSTSCGASLENIPNLQKMYEKYKDQGLLIIGVYSSMDSIEDVQNIVAYESITYPIIAPDVNLSLYLQMASGSTPVSYIFDGEGNPLESVPNIGSHSFKKWEEIILEYLQ